MKNNINQTTFWSFIKKNEVEIPIIQRDYAQGRIGQEKLRARFLKDIKNSLDGKLHENEKHLKLDFVYGSYDHDSINPLDGQQRLTTLWLLHWYIAFRAGSLKENKNVFKKFSYETRTSSREFCIKLSELDIDEMKITSKLYSKDKLQMQVVKLIENQNWFFSSWKQDPTIQAMLNMLGGTKNNANSNNKNLDGIEKVFEGHSTEDFHKYWKLLTSNDCPIIFYYLDLKGLTLSDDLYIKMNARGKQLTDFENFKADFLGIIRDKNIDANSDNPTETIGHKIDVNWTSIFWKSKSQNNKIDSIYFAFINRFLLNYLITVKNDTGSYIYTADQLEKKNKTFSYLYGSKSDDKNVKYSNFDIYLESEDVFQEKLINNLVSLLDNFYKAFIDKSKEETNKTFSPTWHNVNPFTFIPKYTTIDKKETITSLTQTQRVVFYAVCSYLIQGSYEENSFRQWMRIVWNILENANIDTISTMIGAMRLIDDLSKYSHDIYKHLKNRNISNDFAKAQMEEEKEKAKQIHNDASDEWENKIILAEGTAFFKGSIRFLVKNESGEYDWSHFDNRFNNAGKYFDKNGVTEKYKKNAILLRRLISYFIKWDQFWLITYDNNASSWKNIITNEKLLVPLNNLLDNEIHHLREWDSYNIANFNLDHTHVRNDLVCTALLEKVEEFNCRLNWRHSKHTLYPPRANANWKKYVIGDERNKVFSNLIDNGIINCDQRLADTPFFWGWEIKFKLKNNSKSFEWWNNLKEMTETGEWKEVKDITLNNLEEYLKKQ